MEPFNGDFIQRHARAAALYNDIYVVHVAADETGATGSTEQIIRTADGLTEHIIYFKKPASFLGKIQSGLTWLSLSKRAIREYIHQQGKPDLIHVHIPVKAGIAAIWANRKYKIPFVVTEHWGIYNAVEVLNYNGRSIAFKHYTKKIIQKAKAFISVSKFLAEGVNRMVVKKAYQIIPNVVDTHLFYYNDKKDRSTSIFRFIHVSNMVPLKNAEGILKAFHLLLQHNSRAELVLVGDTGTALKELAAETGIPEDRLSFRGEIAYELVAEEMQEAHCLVIFSYIENSPCVIGEALCCGLPIIATEVGGIPELLSAENSLLVKPGDIQGLLQAMLQMIEQQDAYGHKKIAELATNKFSYPVIGKKIDDVYLAVLKG